MSLCPKCGSEIPDGELICPVCSYEIQLVPDYETLSSSLLDKNNALENDAELSDEIYKCLKSNLTESKVYTASEFTKSGNSSSGSEDFAYISAKVPSLMVAVAAGDSRQGHTHPLHHPEVTFDESALATGAAVYALAAFNRLK